MKNKEKELDLKKEDILKMSEAGFIKNKYKLEVFEKLKCFFSILIDRYKIDTIEAQIFLDLVYDCEDIKLKYE